MSQTFVNGFLWFAAIGCGLMAGVYFAFSSFIMTALARLEPMTAISAMNSINTTILGSWFMPLFFGTTLASLVLTISGLYRWNLPGGKAMVAAGLIYLAGMFLCTVIFNVPLNQTLAATHTGGADAALTWQRYLREWTLWNHVRTVSSITSSALFIGALVTR